MVPVPVSYWILAAGGLLLACAWFLFSARRTGIPVSRAAAGAVAGLVLAFLFAKGFYLLFKAPALAGEGAGKWFRLVPGEFSFVAGCVGFCLGPVLCCLRRRKLIPRLLDCLALPGCLLVACLRFGEIWLGQLGLTDVYTLGLPDIADGSFPARFPFAVRDAWGIWYLAGSTWAALFALLVCAFFLVRRKPLPEGLLFEKCAFLLCAGRLFFELIRMDCLVAWFVHVDQALCALVMLGLMIRAGLRQKEKTGKFPFLSLILFLLCIALNGVTQYLLDKPWQFQPLLPEGLFRWINANLRGIGLSVFFLTSLVPALLHARLCRKA